ncbi:hypothetical protein ABBQ38_005944 [Trebouxia sp. C0009 RCD-2024]
MDHHYDWARLCTWHTTAVCWGDIQIKFTDHYPLESPEVLLLAAHIAMSPNTPNVASFDITRLYIHKLCRLHLSPQALCIRISTAMGMYAWTFFMMVEMGAGHLH